MFIEPPKGRSSEEIYLWCLELCEKINRELSGIKESSNKEDDK